MNTWSFVNWLPIIISTLAFGFSIFVFLYDLKVRKQQKAINEFNIQKHKKELEEEKKAIIEANVIDSGNAKRIIKIYNRGKDTAKNVKVTFLGNPDIHVHNYLSPTDISPQNYMDIKVNFHINSPQMIEIDFEWEDKFNSHNKRNQKIQLF